MYLAAREMQIKSILRFHLQSERQLSRIQAILSVGKDVGENVDSHIVGGTAGLLQPLWKAVQRFLRKLGMEPPFGPAIPLLSLYPKDLKSACYSDTATSMFIAAQFMIDKLWNQRRYPQQTNG